LPEVKLKGDEVGSVREITGITMLVSEAREAFSIDFVICSLHKTLAVACTLQ
jgi:hypothetical protein